VRTGGAKALSVLRLAAAALLACSLVPATLASTALSSPSRPAVDVLGVSGALPDGGVSAPDIPGSPPGVDIVLPPTADKTPDGWEKPPVIAQLIPEGPGTIYYRFGAGPGTWQQCSGPVVIPAGKQTLSAVLVAPDGMAGPVSTVTARSDVHVLSDVLADTTVIGNGSTVVYSGSSTVAGTVNVSVSVGRQLGTLVRRLGGQDRYDTSTIISAAEPSHSKTVIIATGEKFPDALTASGLAGCLDAPVLLVSKDHIPPTTSLEIKRLGAKRAVICGGTPSVSNNVVARLRSMGLSVSRLAGKTRYETAVAVAKRIQQLTGKHSRVFLARGTVFTDALVIAPLAYSTRSPILLSTSTTLYPNTAKQLTSAHYSYATLIGGGLGARVESSVRGRVPSVDRWSGTDACDTSVNVAASSVSHGGQTWGYVGIARGDIFADALCGGVLAGTEHGVILLTPPTSLDPSVSNALQAHAADVRRCEIYGSPAAINNDVYNQITAIFH
jgi:putative cell wall-binding protein